MYEKARVICSGRVLDHPWHWMPPPCLDTIVSGGGVIRYSHLQTALHGYFLRWTTSATEFISNACAYDACLGHTFLNVFSPKSLDDLLRLTDRDVFLQTYLPLYNYYSDYLWLILGSAFFAPIGIHKLSDAKYSSDQRSFFLSVLRKQT